MSGIEKSNVVIHTMVWGIIYFTKTVFQNYFLKFPAAINSLLCEITTKAKLSLLFLPRRTAEIALCVFCFYRFCLQACQPIRFGKAGNINVQPVLEHSGCKTSCREQCCEVF